MPQHRHQLDLITIGRSSVDLYGTQIGGLLENMGSFEKYIGGSPTNIAAGAARLGLKSALITRVGDEHMGRFIRAQLRAEGVDVSGVITDPDRLTALVLLGIRDQHNFPLIFYRENCADMALCEDDIDADLIASARAVLATGTHLSHPQVEAATLKALRLARAAGARTALDIDYRPNLWGVAGHGAGESRFVESAAVTEKLQSTLHLFDLIVGTEEEFHIAGGTGDTIKALRAVRALSGATLVCKRGPMGASLFTGQIPDTLEGGETGAGFAVEVFNVLGAGDGFMSGLLAGWLQGANWATALTWANACGAFAVSRHGCTPAYPSRAELDLFLKQGVRTAALREDTALEQLHWSTTRNGDWPVLRVLAFDHRQQFEELNGATPEKIAAFKGLCLDAATRVAAGQPGHGVLCDGQLGRDALHKASGTGLWVARPTQVPTSRPLTPEPELGVDFGALREWPKNQVVKVQALCHPDDGAGMGAAQEDVVRRLFAAARRNRQEFLLEVIPPRADPVDDDTTPKLIQRVYDIGIFPDWWQLVPFRTKSAWHKVCETIERNDPHSRAILALGPDAPAAVLQGSFKLAAGQPLVRGFAVGRAVIGDSARAWMAGGISDQDAVTAMSRRYASICALWDEARAQTGHKVKDGDTR